MPAKLKVLLAVPELEALGVQHDIRCLMRHWDRERFEPIMLLHRRQGSFADQFPPEMLSVQVDERVLDIRGLRILLRIGGYARVFREVRPDAVISFVPYPNLACAAARPLSGHDFGLAVSEHAHVTASLRDTAAFGPGFRSVYRLVFPRVYNEHCDIVKCIAEESRQDLIVNHGIRAEKTRLIYNPVEFEEVRSLAGQTPDHPWFEAGERKRHPIIINVGRLESQKRQDILIRAFAAVNREVSARLVLVGQGSWQPKLESLARELGVLQDVAFLGFQRNPWQFMARASVLAMSSDWEGLPCVLTEATVLGLPIVSTRCPSGPSEMLLEGRAGLLCPVDDPAALAAGILEVLQDPEAARERAACGTEALGRFEPEAVTRRYEDLTVELAELGLQRRRS